MIEQKELNLDILLKQYREKGEALRAFRQLNRLVELDDPSELKRLLRDHRVHPVHDDLLHEQRDGVDKLLDFYSLTEVGILSGYLPEELPVKLRKEVIRILGNELVQSYYRSYYPLLLPQALLERLTNGGGGNSAGNDASAESECHALYNRFLLLTQTIRYDKDIGRFLHFMDDGAEQGYSIINLWSVLSGEGSRRYKPDRFMDSPLDSAVFGFMKYLRFLSGYASLLRDSESFPILQSAFWHYQSYWFDQMNEKLDDIIRIAIYNIRSTLYFWQASGQNHHQGYKWDEYSMILNEAENDIAYLLDKNHGQALDEYVSSLKGEPV